MTPTRRLHRDHQVPHLLAYLVLMFYVYKRSQHWFGYQAITLAKVCPISMASLGYRELTHWSRVTHIWVADLNIIGSDNGLSPGRRQAITWTNAGILLIGQLGTNFSEILIEIQTFSFKKLRLKVSSEKWRPFCLGLNVLSPSYDTWVNSHSNIRIR